MVSENPSLSARFIIKTISCGNVDARNSTKPDQLFLKNDAPALPSSDREAILRRATIRAIPDYYAWPEIERERIRLNRPKRQDYLIRQALLSSLFGIEMSSDETLLPQC
jgi:hypothetical protein